MKVRRFEVPDFRIGTYTVIKLYPGNFSINSNSSSILTPGLGFLNFRSILIFHRGPYTHVSFSGTVLCPSSAGRVQFLPPESPSGGTTM